MLISTVPPAYQFQHPTPEGVFVIISEPTVTYQVTQVYVRVHSFNIYF